MDVACRAFHQEVTVEVYNQDDDFSDDEGEVSPREVRNATLYWPVVGNLELKIAPNNPDVLGQVTHF